MTSCLFVGLITAADAAPIVGVMTKLLGSRLLSAIPSSNCRTMESELIGFGHQ